MTSANTVDTNIGTQRETPAGRVKGACMLTLGAAIVVGVTAISLMVMIAPDGPVMKTAMKGMLDHQHAVAVAYLK